MVVLNEHKDHFRVIEKGMLIEKVYDLGIFDPETEYLDFRMRTSQDHAHCHIRYKE